MQGVFTLMNDSPNLHSMQTVLPVVFWKNPLGHSLQFPGVPNCPKLHSEVVVVLEKIASHPSSALLFVLNLSALHVTAMHPLASAVSQAVHVPPVTAAQLASHPSAALLFVSNL